VRELANLLLAVDEIADPGDLSRHHCFCRVSGTAEGYVDPWQLIQPRAAWVTVILIAGLGFTNYVLLKLYGARGIAVTGFFGGLVNSTVTVTELSQRVSTPAGMPSPAMKKEARSSGCVGA